MLQIFYTFVCILYLIRRNFWILTRFKNREIASKAANTNKICDNVYYLKYYI